MTTSSPSLLVDTPIEGVVRLTLNDPEKLNSLKIATYEALFAELERIRYDPSVRVVILTGAGRGFCSGHQLGSGTVFNKFPKDVGALQGSRYFLNELAKVPLMMRALPQPIIAAVNGVCAGIGFTLALAAEITIAARSAKFINAFNNVGTGCEVGFSYLLPRAIGLQRAAELMLTARPVLADEAERIGLVLKTVPDENLQDECLALARAIMNNPPITTWTAKQNLWMNQGVSSLDVAIEFEHRGIATLIGSEDVTEKRASFMEKRPPVFHNK